MDAAFEARVESLRYSHGVPGLSIAASRRGEKLFSLALGLEDPFRDVPMSQDSVHELASISKGFTAVGILRLVDQNLLRLSDRVSEILGAPIGDPDVTIQQLLQHTHGLADYLDYVAENATSDAVLTQLAIAPKRFAARTRFEYSNTGYWLLGLVAERVTGLPITEFYRRFVIEPAGLQHTFPNHPGFPVRHRVQGTTMKRGRLIPCDKTPGHWAATGDGGILASATDLLVWVDRVVHGTLLSESSRTLMFTASPEAKGTYGMGWCLSPGEISHAGGWNGTETLLTHHHASETTYAILLNTDEVEAAVFEPLVRAHLGLNDAVVP